MKMSRLLAAAVLGSFVLMTGPVAAQGDVATYSKEAMDDLVHLFTKAAKDGYTMENSTTTMFGGWLPRGRAQGDERWIPMITLRSLDPQRVYRIIAAGDKDTKDLDIRVLDPNGNVVAVDTSVYRDAEVTFRPARRQDYTIEMRLYDSTDNCICIGAVLRYNGRANQTNVSTYAKQAMDDLINYLSKAAKDGFAMEPATITTFGGWLPRGNGTGNERWQSMLVLWDLEPGRTYRFIASADDDAKDLDLRIVDQAGNVVAEDVLVNRAAEVTFRPTRKQDYTIQMRLYDSRDNCVCIGAILRHSTPAPAQNLARDEILRRWRQANDLHKARRFGEALAIYERITADVEASYGKNSITVANLLSWIISSHQQNLDYAKTEPFYQRVLYIRETQLGKDHLDTAKTLNELANLYAKLGKHDKAEPLLRRSLQIREAKLGNDHPDVAATLTVLANDYRARGQYLQAEPLYRRSLEIYQAKNHPNVASAVKNLGYLYRDMGQNDKAEPLLERGVQISKEKFVKALAEPEAKKPANTGNPVKDPNKNNLPNLYVLTIGVSAYPQMDMKLKYAAKDARVLGQTFQSTSHALYRTVEVKTVADGEATRRNILQGLAWLRKEMTQRDVAIVSFAGHGDKDSGGQFYLFPVDVDSKDLVSTGIPGDQVKNLLSSIPGKTILLLDACHSGTVGGTKRRAGGSLTDDLVRDLATDESGVIVMSSSMGREFSLESDAAGHGYFTLALIEGLKGKADYNKDQLVHWQELDQYVTSRVKELSNGGQHPVTTQPTNARAFALTRLP